MGFPDQNWLIHLCFFIAIATFVVSVICHCAHSRFLKWCERFEPTSQLFLLRTFAVLPIAAGITLALMVSLPSITHNSMLPLDHCHYSQDCFNGPVSHFASTFELLVLFLFGFVLLKAIARTGNKILCSIKLQSKIQNLQQEVYQKNSVLIEAKEPMAFSIGFLKPTIVFSTGLLDKISDDTFNIIQCHERVHQQHKDSFSKLIVGFFAQFHTPSCQKKTLEQHSLVLELRADLKTGSDAQKSLAVAETILELHKLFQAQTPDAITCSFSGSNVEQRVHYLINPPKQSSLEKRFVLACFAGSAIVAIFGSAPFHNLLEVFFLL